MKPIVNIVICYENEGEIIQYAKSLSCQSISYSIALIIVVNKASSISLQKLIKKELNKSNIDIIIFNPKSNLGYLNGLIYGYNRYCELIKDKPTWIVMSNTDIEFQNNLFFEDFLKKNYEDDIWCIAPSVYSPSKDSYDNPQYIERYTLKKINRLIDIFSKPKFAYYYIKLSTLKAKMLRKKRIGSQFIYSAHGCFFIIRNELGEILRNKKYGALMYSEEAFIAETIRNNGKKSFYDCTIEVIHNESSVTGKLDAEKKFSYISDSLKIIRDEFFTNVSS